LALIAELVPRMLEQHSGVVVNVTSLGQIMTWPMMGPYTATKAALASATETLRLELAGTGVRVVEVIPGPVATAVQAESALLPGFGAAMRSAPLGDPTTIAKQIVRAIEGRSDRIVYPRSLLGAYALPGLTRRYVARLARRHTDSVGDTRVLRSGTFGDPAARAAREAWTTARRRSEQMRDEPRQSQKATEQR
jgi:short-subunit dehydrogenase